MTAINITELRMGIRRYANKVCYEGERICVQRNNEPAFAMISYEDLKILEALENKIDLQSALEALEEEGSITHEELKKKLGI
jgi:PHD/YefM family antitoxin component YafN of YafNO toxin-antitoxin module